MPLNVSNVETYVACSDNIYGLPNRALFVWKIVCDKTPHAHTSSDVIARPMTPVIILDLVGNTVAIHF